MQCHGFVMYDSRFTTCTYKFFLIYFFLLSLYYINLNFDCPFNTKVIQTLNDEFKSQKTLQQRKFPRERNCLRSEFFFLQTILIFEQPILFDSFNVRFENAENIGRSLSLLFFRGTHAPWLHGVQTRQNSKAQSQCAMTKNLFLVNGD